MKTKQKLELTATIRHDVGKGASRRLRKNDLVPAVVYGDNIEPINITMYGNELRKASEKEAFYSQMLSIKLNDKSYKVLLKDLQRHPVKSTISHLDFINVTDKTIVILKIPIHFINEDKCLGVKTQGGLINHQATDVEVRCKAADLPEFIEVDMASIKLGQAIHLSDINYPKGVDSVMLRRGKEYDLVISNVVAPRGGVSSDEGAEEENTEEG